MGIPTLEQLRLARYWLARTLVFALLLPLLVGLLPQPSLSVAAALERDLAWSVCDPAKGVPGEGKEHNQRQGAQCILCATGCPLGAPVHVGHLTISISRKLRGFSAELPETDSLIVPAVLRAGSPTRGPPLV